ncbi:hypothetical protein HYV70_03550 [Candidatus Uhrbacteria bacterium]|nr:hypothetical protein [Candidatus Uhrbacteria bacterium]
MKKDRTTQIVVTCVVAFVMVFLLVMGIRGIKTYEDWSGRYPIISQETIKITQEMDSNWDFFESSCKKGDKEALYEAVRERNRLNEKIQWGQIRSLTLGTTWHTHSEWICGTDKSLTIKTYLGPPGCKSE